MSSQVWVGKDNKGHLGEAGLLVSLEAGLVGWARFCRSFKLCEQVWALF
jgi:hypothetical protein